MRFDMLTIFPQFFQSLSLTGIVAKAVVNQATTPLAEFPRCW